MKVIKEKFDDVMVVTLDVEILDASVADNFKNAIVPILRSETQVVLDMNNIQFVDSSGLGAILTCLRIINAQGGELKICSLTKTVSALFEMVRMNSIFGIFNSRELALESF